MEGPAVSPFSPSPMSNDVRGWNISSKHQVDRFQESLKCRYSGIGHIADAIVGEQWRIIFGVPSTNQTPHYKKHHIIHLVRHILQGKQMAGAALRFLLCIS